MDVTVGGSPSRLHNAEALPVCTPEHDEKDLGPYDRNDLPFDGECLSKGLQGRGLKCRPFPRPLLLLLPYGRCKTFSQTRRLCPKKLCHLRGHPTVSGRIAFGFALR